MPTRAFRVTGRVQGVGFRWWTRGRAEALGLAGSVRNLADGSVEVIARGDDDRLDLLRNALEKGPPGAAVESVEASPAAPLAATGFEIVR